MTETTRSTRMHLIRDTAILQLKLLVDGARDALLIPVSLLAAILGLIRGGADADREFQRVIKLGRRSERWINLFGHQAPLGRANPGSSLDLLLDSVETRVLGQHSKGRDTEKAQATTNAAMDGTTQDPDQPGTENDVQ